MHRVPKVALIDILDAICFENMKQTVQNSLVVVITLRLKSHLHSFEGKVEKQCHILTYVSAEEIK